ncbi:lysosomal alpha-glucosidase-like, partial [Saccoglossus kowalevskii]
AVFWECSSSVFSMKSSHSCYIIATIVRMSRCLALVVFLLVAGRAHTQQCNVDDNVRFDCFPEDGVTQSKCEARGCCWRLPKSSGNHTTPPRRGGRLLPTQDVPYCFYPSDYPTYSLSNLKETDYGYTGDLRRSTHSYYPKDIMQLKLDVYFETNTRLHFKIYDANSQRYEVPIETPKVTKKVPRPNYEVDFVHEPFSLRVARFDSGQGMNETLFNTNITRSFMFTDQFIQISSILPTSYIYGLGEHRAGFLHSLNWTRLTMWARDIPPVVFLGPSPDQVIQQYTEVIGRPFMPPYWSLGFHLCRWGYGSSDKTQQVVEKMRKAGIPQDGQWNDIDYMDKHLDWTYDKTNFSGLSDVVKDLHDHGQHYVNIIDPGISNQQPKGSYAPYDDGLSIGAFITFANGSLVKGQVWPGETVYPDFTNPVTKVWWTAEAKAYHDKINYDGLWIDMNEPSNFVDGSILGCPDNSYEHPPYTPDVLGDKLSAFTVCVSAKQYWSTHYNVHNLYGMSEMIASHDALANIRGKRPLVISRSTFPSSGKYGGHWLGDNNSLWKDMWYSIPGILNFNLFGIPLVGADICGFGGTTTEELCQRWQQLGAFYPFSRNHNTLGSKDQDPTSFSPAMQKSTRDILLIRYSLLPYLYTLFHKGHVTGSTIVRPLFFEFSMDQEAFTIDRQFLWGSSLLISPVLEENATSVNAYFPADTWYDFYTGTRVTSQPSKGKMITLDAPLDKLNLHVRGGRILPTQDPNTTTTASRNNKYGLIVAMSMGSVANGELFWDDGDTLSTYENGKYIFMKFSAVDNKITSTVIKNGYPYADKMELGSTRVFGVAKQPTSVSANGKAATFTYDSKTQMLTVSDMSLPMKVPINITWKY